MIFNILSNPTNAWIGLAVFTVLASLYLIVSKASLIDKLYDTLVIFAPFTGILLLIFNFFTFYNEAMHAFAATASGMLFVSYFALAKITQIRGKSLDAKVNYFLCIMFAFIMFYFLSN